MSRAFVNEDAGGWGDPSRRFLLPPRDDPGFDAAAAEALRSEKRHKFGGVKYVYPRRTMGELRGWFEQEIARRFPEARVLYFT